MRIRFCQRDFAGKTQKFTVEIEKRQKELAPWTEKINDKQAEINVATSERDALMKKAQDHEEALHAAEEHLKELRSDQKVKADGLNETKAKRASVDDDIREASMRVEVGSQLVLCLRMLTTARLHALLWKIAVARLRLLGSVSKRCGRLRRRARVREMSSTLSTVFKRKDASAASMYVFVS